MNTTVFAAPKGISAPAPGWVTYITIAISSISMLVALFTFLRGGVRIKLKVVYAYRSVISTNPDGDEKANAQSVVRLQVTNRRRGEIDISDFILIPPRASDAPKVSIQGCLPPVGFMLQAGRRRGAAGARVGRLGRH
jgi:hypothetical protein